MSEDLEAELSQLSEDQRRLFLLLLAKEGVDPSQLPIRRRAWTGPAPLSWTQERLWNLGRAAGGVPWGSVPLALEIRGPLPSARLAAGLAELVGRHASLRTSFREVDGRPVQILEPDAALATQVTDLRGLATERRGAEVERRSIEAALRPFDLARAPLVHSEILELGEEEHVLLLTLHHLVADGWAIRLLLKDLSSILRAFAASSPPPAPEAPIEYVDFAAWQREWMTPEALRPQIKYWKGQLRGARPPALPGARPLQGAPSFRGAVVQFSLRLSLSRALRSLSRLEGVTLFMTILAALQALLHQSTGEVDIAVATAISNRSRPETEKVVGNFANNLLLRVDLSGDPTFREALRRVRAVVTDAYGRQDLPLEMLAAELERDGSSWVIPPFRAMLILRDSPVERNLDVPALAVRRLAVETCAAGLDLTLDISDGGAELHGSAELRTDVLDPATVGRLLAQLQRILEAVVADPSVPLSRLPPLLEPAGVVPSPPPGAGPGLPAGPSVPTEVAGAGPPRRSARYVPPRTDAERRLVRIWEKMLGVQPIGVEDSFFELGGHSLLVSRLWVALERELGQAPPVRSFFENPRIRHVASLLAAPAESRPGWALLEPLQPLGSLPPFVAIEAAVGLYDALARRLGPEQPFYGLSSRIGLDGEAPPYAPATRLEEVASLYLERLCAFQPHGPYYIGGHCFGGLVAYEMARQLSARGEPVGFLGLIDAFPLRRNSRFYELHGSAGAGSALLRRLRRIGDGILESLKDAKHALEHSVLELAYLTSRMQAGLLRRPASGALLQRRSVCAAALLLRSYAPGGYGGRAGLFVSEAFGSSDVELWSGLVGGGSDFYRVPGDHLSLFAEPAVQVLAEKLRGALEKAHGGKG